MKKLPAPTTPLATAIADTIRAQRHACADKVPAPAGYAGPLSGLLHHVRQQLPRP